MMNAFQDLSELNRYSPTPTSPRRVVYFDGMTDVLTLDEFRAHDWHVAYSDEITSTAQLEAAHHALKLDSLTGEPIFEQSPGWHPAAFAHDFVSNPIRPAYCAFVRDTGIDHPVRCDHHAR